jgi:hypothetical protein
MFALTRSLELLAKKLVHLQVAYCDMHRRWLWYRVASEKEIKAVISRILSGCGERTVNNTKEFFNGHSPGLCRVDVRVVP